MKIIKDNKYPVTIEELIEKLGDSICIGRFILTKHKDYPGEVLIECEGGDGGRFSENEVEAVIENYYQRNL